MHVRTPSRWPFWLLLAAWFCANSPQGATYELVLWLGKARHFSHQQRLTTEVASILAGVTASEINATVQDSPDHPLTPPMPASATLKKIDVLVTVLTEPNRLVERSHLLVINESVPPAAPWREPLGEPPRVG